MSPDAKQLLLEYLFADLGGLMPMPPEKRARSVTCCTHDGKIVVTMEAEDGEVYAIACGEYGGDVYCFPYKPCNEIGGEEVALEEEEGGA